MVRAVNHLMREKCIAILCAAVGSKLSTIRKSCDSLNSFNVGKKDVWWIGTNRNESKKQFEGWCDNDTNMLHFPGIFFSFYWMLPLLFAPLRVVVSGIMLQIFLGDESIAGFFSQMICYSYFRVLKPFTNIVNAAFLSLKNVIWICV